MILTIFIIAGACFVGYAILTYWGSTPSDQSRAHRAWLSIMAAVTALSAAVVQLFHSAGSP